MTKDKELIYHTLANEIVRMDLKPGDMLKEIEVAQRFSVSRTPIRDVFKKLEYDGLLVIHSQKGSYVSRINLNGITDIMYIRDQVELSVLSELIHVITPGDIADLRMILNDQTMLLASYDADLGEISSKFFDLDNEFHTHIYRRAGKESVLLTLNGSWPSFSRFRFLTFQRDKSMIENLCNIHKDIVDALEKRDSSCLDEIVRNHNFSGLNGIETVREKHPDYFN
jgi:DNA-binding GntR family transcriptional regulator